MHRAVSLGFVAISLTLTFACSGEPDEPDPIDPGPEPASEPGPAPLPRLTEAQLVASVHDVLGESIVVPARLEPDAAIEGLVAIGSARTSFSPLGAERIEAASYDLARQAMEPGEVRDRLVGCEPYAVVDDGCAYATLRTLGRRLWRRPLGEDELARLVLIATTAAAELGDFYDGLEFGIAALIQSPNFLFRIELGEPDPEQPERLRYTNYEMASRLSYFLWNTTPDDALLDAAERGDLSTPEGVREQAERLIASPRARAAVRNFFSDLFTLYELDALSKDPTVFTHMSAEVGPAAREETLTLIEQLVFDEQGDYRSLFTTRRTFMDRRLAAIYGVRAPVAEGFGETEWDEGAPRSGILTHISLLALNSHPVASSATLRGKFIRRTLLCGFIPPPPTDVDTSIPEPSENARTLRERIAVHLEDEFCASCHKVMDPIGLGLENFDALGRWRDTENDAVIDPSGVLDEVPFANPRELGQAIADHPDLGRCLAKHMYRYASSRLEAVGERELMAHLGEVFAANDHRVLDLMLAIVVTDSFRHTLPAASAQESN